MKMIIEKQNTKEIQTMFRGEADDFIEQTPVIHYANVYN